MTTLEKVTNMKSQGISESEIINNLKGEGISPKEISDALTQSQIKQAVSSEGEGKGGAGGDNMQPSIMGTSLSESSSPPNPASNQIPQEDIYEPQISQQDNYANPQGQVENQAYAPQVGGEEYYPQESYQQPYAESGIDNMIEIAEQVFIDKIKKMQNQFNELIGFKTISETKIQNISERLKRMEKMFDQMQISIINKVGNYGKGLETLKKELEMVEDSFSKVVNTTISKKTHSKKKK